MAGADTPICGYTDTPIFWVRLVICEKIGGWAAQFCTFLNISGRARGCDSDFKDPAETFAPAGERVAWARWSLGDWEELGGLFSRGERGSIGCHWAPARLCGTSRLSLSLDSGLRVCDLARRSAVRSRLASRGDRSGGRQVGAKIRARCFCCRSEFSVQDSVRREPLQTMYCKSLP